jgi:two-component system nitrogen regulation response regulator GlnG
VAKILVVDDEAAICWAFRTLIEAEGHEALVAPNAARALEIFERERPDMVFLDVRLPDEDGIATLRAMKAARPEANVVVVTALGGFETTVAAMQAGALDYLVKPVDAGHAREAIRRAVAPLPAEPPAPSEPGGAREAPAAPLLVGRSAVMQELFKRIAAVAATDVPVLIQGESGTGKELVARAIHVASPRRDGPFEPIDCAALPADLVESELYGHERGAFTGAVRDRVGRVRLAHGGTLFLDEVGELPLPAQAKLLRFLSEREIVPVGGRARVAVDARIVAATNRPLERAVAAGAFREDLFYRLNVVALHVPPLRARREDIPALVARFSGRGEKPGISADALAVLERYSWPGNVRELRNAVEHALALARGPLILPEHLPAHVRGAAASAAGGALTAAGEAGDSPASFDLRALAAALIDRALADGRAPYAEAIRRLEEALFAEAMARSGGSRSAAARLLAINRATLRKRLRES